MRNLLCNGRLEISGKREKKGASVFYYIEIGEQIKQFFENRFLWKYLLQPDLKTDNKKGDVTTSLLMLKNSEISPHLR